MKQVLVDVCKGTAVVTVAVGFFVVCAMCVDKCDRTQRDDTKVCEPFKKVHTFIDDDTRKRYVVCMDENKNLVVK